MKHRGTIAGHRLLALMLIICLIAGSFPMTAAAAAGDFAGGDGSEGSPFIIMDVSQLKHMVSETYGTKGYYFSLQNDLDLSSAQWKWGDFCGVFNGNNYTISGLHDYALFNNVGPKAGASLASGIKIQNLKLGVDTIDLEKAAGTKVSALSAVINGTEACPVSIENVHVTIGGTIKTTSQAGGLIAQAAYTTVKNCSVTLEKNAAIRAEGVDAVAAAGGILSHFYGTNKIESSYVYLNEGARIIAENQTSEGTALYAGAGGIAGTGSNSGHGIANNVYVFTETGSRISASLPALTNTGGAGGALGAGGLLGVSYSNPGTKAIANGYVYSLGTITAANKNGQLAANAGAVFGSVGKGGTLTKMSGITAYNSQGIPLRGVSYASGSSDELHTLDGVKSATAAQMLQAATFTGMTINSTNSPWVQSESAAPAGKTASVKGVPYLRMENNPSISPMAVGYVPGETGNIVVQLNNGIPTSVSKGASALNNGTDYRISGQKLTFMSSYLQSLGSQIGSYVYTFTYADGYTQSFTIMVTAYTGPYSPQAAAVLSDGGNGLCRADIYLSDIRTAAGELSVDLKGTGLASKTAAGGALTKLSDIELADGLTVFDNTPDVETEDNITADGLQFGWRLGDERLETDFLDATKGQVLISTLYFSGHDGMTPSEAAAKLAGKIQLKAVDNNAYSPKIFSLTASIENSGGEGGAFAGGSGTSVSPYQIDSAELLAKMVSEDYALKGYHFVLTSNIEVTEPWKTADFYGVLDGGGYIIRGLDRPLFGILQGGTAGNLPGGIQIKNLNMTVGDISAEPVEDPELAGVLKGSGGVSPLAYEARGTQACPVTISNVHTTISGTVEAESQAAGIISRVFSTSVKNCSVTVEKGGQILADGDGQVAIAAGILPHLTDGCTVQGCFVLLKNGAKITANQKNAGNMYAAAGGLAATGSNTSHGGANNVYVFLEAGSEISAAMPNSASVGSAGVLGAGGLIGGIYSSAGIPIENGYVYNLGTIGASNKTGALEVNTGNVVGSIASAGKLPNIANIVSYSDKSYPARGVAYTGGSSDNTRTMSGVLVVTNANAMKWTATYPTFNINGSNSFWALKAGTAPGGTQASVTGLPYLSYEPTLAISRGAEAAKIEANKALAALADYQDPDSITDSEVRDAVRELTAQAALWIDTYLAKGGKTSLLDHYEYLAAAQANVLDGAFAGGSGMADSPFRIATTAQLTNLTSPFYSQKGYHFELTTDFDISTVDWNSESFFGVLDGGGHTITGMKAPLFSTLEAPDSMEIKGGIQIEDLRLGVNSLVAGEKSGKISPIAYNTNLTAGTETVPVVITDVHVNVEGTISAASQAAGLICNTAVTRIKNCSVTIEPNGRILAEGDGAVAVAGGMLTHLTSLTSASNCFVLLKEGGRITANNTGTSDTQYAAAGGFAATGSTQAHGSADNLYVIMEENSEILAESPNSSGIGSMGGVLGAGGLIGASYSAAAGGNVIADGYVYSLGTIKAVNKIGECESNSGSILGSIGKGGRLPNVDGFVAYTLNGYPARGVSYSTGTSDGVQTMEGVTTVQDSLSMKNASTYPSLSPASGASLWTMSGETAPAGRQSTAAGLPYLKMEPDLSSGKSLTAARIAAGAALAELEPYQEASSITGDAIKLKVEGLITEAEAKVTAYVDLGGSTGNLETYAYIAGARAAIAAYEGGKIDIEQAKLEADQAIAALADYQKPAAITNDTVKLKVEGLINAAEVKADIYVQKGGTVSELTNYAFIAGAKKAVSEYDGGYNDKQKAKEKANEALKTLEQYATAGAITGANAEAAKTAIDAADQAVADYLDWSGTSLADLTNQEYLAAAKSAVAAYEAAQLDLTAAKTAAEEALGALSGYQTAETITTEAISVKVQGLVAIAEAKIEAYTAKAGSGPAEALTGYAYLQGAKDALAAYEAAKGTTVSGIVSSYNPKVETTVQLLQGDTVVYTTTIAAINEMGQAEQEFNFDKVAKGMYTLLITKPGHTSYTLEELEIGAEPLDLSTSTDDQIAVCRLYVGDYNDDGLVTGEDLNILWGADNYGLAIDGEGAAANRYTDINGDGLVTGEDLNILWSADNYGMEKLVIRYTK